MASGQATAAVSGLIPYRLTVKQFLKMIDANILSEDTRVELLGGMLVAMTTNVLHNYIVIQLSNLLRQRIPGEWSIREEKSIQLGRTWRPEPDLAVIRAPNTAFGQRDPSGADVALLVEVADSTYV